MKILHIIIMATTLSCPAFAFADQANNTYPAICSLNVATDVGPNDELLVSCRIDTHGNNKSLESEPSHPVTPQMNTQLASVATMEFGERFSGELS